MVDRRVVNSHDASTVASVVSKLDRRRVLIVSNTIDFEGNSHAKKLDTFSRFDGTPDL